MKPTILLATRVRDRGFSLVEVTLSLGIVTFALVSILGVLPTALASSRQSVDQNRAAAIANTLFTSFRSQPFQTVGYLDEQFTTEGKLLPSPETPLLDLNALGTTATEVKAYVAFFDVSLPADCASDSLGAQRHVKFAKAQSSPGDYLVKMHFNSQPDGMTITPQPSATANGRPLVPAQVNQVELVISAVARPKDQYHFVSNVANRTN